MWVYLSLSTTCFEIGIQNREKHTQNVNNDLKFPWLFNRNFSTIEARLLDISSYIIYKTNVSKLNSILQTYGGSYKNLL